MQEKQAVYSSYSKLSVLNFGLLKSKSLEFQPLKTYFEITNGKILRILIQTNNNSCKNLR